jgi:hypothetical protein
MLRIADPASGSNSVETHFGSGLGSAVDDMAIWLGEWLRAQQGLMLVGAERLDDELGDPPRLLDGSEMAGSRNDDKTR